MKRLNTRECNATPVRITSYRKNPQPRASYNNGYTPNSNRRNRSGRKNLIEIQTINLSDYQTTNSRNQPKSPVTPRLPSFLLINARSLLPKIDELALLLQIQPLEFVTITETWLNDEVLDQLIHINDYNTFRNDRSHGRGGGVCAFVSTNIPIIRRKDLENPVFECLWLWLRPYRLPRHLTGLICCVLYSPPDTLIHEQKELSAYIVEPVGPN